MSNYQVIIGAGPAATNAIETIRQYDARCPITLICDEPAHSRMALPYWLSGQVSQEHTYTGDAESFREMNVETKFGVRVTHLNSASRQLKLSDDSTLSYDQLLIATGSSALQLNLPGFDLPGVQPLWTIKQTASVLESASAHSKPRVAMIGAGFIGLIMLNAMYKRGWDLTVIERETQILPRMLDASAATLVCDWLESKQIAVHTGREVTEIQQQDCGAKKVLLDDGSAVTADLVIVATGVKPNIEFLKDSGLEIDQGILVDDQMRTNIDHVFAAGDVAQGPALYQTEKVIHPIHPTAVDHGRIAGAVMAGEDVHYPGSLLMNVLDVCGLQNASFGNWDDAQAETTVINNPGQSIYRKYLWRDDQLVGAIFTGRASDLGALNDVGMVKGFLQTQTPFKQWKTYLQENPFDIRRAFIACGVAHHLKDQKLLGVASRPRRYHAKPVQKQVQTGEAHQQFIDAR